jgi:hypothetical protein
MSVNWIRQTSLETGISHGFLNNMEPVIDDGNHRSQSVCVWPQFLFNCVGGQPDEMMAVGLTQTQPTWQTRTEREPEIGVHGIWLPAAIYSFH